MSQGVLCPNLTNKFQLEVSKMADDKLQPLCYKVFWFFIAIELYNPRIFNV